jgi:CheY-like chemotaxis protein
LIAEDDVASRRLLEGLLAKWGYDVVAAAGGDEAWQIIQQENAPRLMVLDWAMPGLDGLELCRRVRAASYSDTPYIILLTAREGKKDIVHGLQAGVDDYITKPFDADELQGRIQVGVRVLGLQSALRTRLKELEDALSRINRLQGLLPICASCKKIRDDKGYWNQVEHYISDHSEAEFTHTICTACVRKLYPEQYREMFHDEIVQSR